MIMSRVKEEETKDGRPSRVQYRILSFPFFFEVTVQYCPVLLFSFRLSAPLLTISTPSLKFRPAIISHPQWLSGIIHNPKAAVAELSSGCRDYEYDDS